MKTLPGCLESHCRINMRALNFLNVFMRYAETLFPREGVFFDFSKLQKGSFRFQLFKENSLAWMLQASHLESMDQVSAFFGAIIDVMCDHKSSPEVTELFTSYVNICMFLQNDDVSSFWTQQELNSLCKKFKDFIAMRKKRFRIVQAWNMVWQKRDLPENLLDPNKDGRIDLIQGGLYESAHKRFKPLYRKPSKCEVLPCTKRLCNTRKILSDLLTRKKE